MLINDINGDPGLILKEDEPRTIHAQGIATSHYFMYTVVVVGLIFISIIMLLLEKQLLSRLTFLRRSVSKIDLSSGNNERIVMPGKDEFAGFSNTINEMVTRLEGSMSALRQSEEKHRSVLESIEEGYYELDDRGKFTLVNDALCQSLGYSKEKLIGTCIWNYVDKNCTVDFNELLLQIWNTGNPIKWISWQAQCQDGAECFIETSIYPICGDKKHVTGYRGIARDVTERKKHESSKNLSQARKVSGEP